MTFWGQVHVWGLQKYESANQDCIAKKDMGL